MGQAAWRAGFPQLRPFTMVLAGACNAGAIVYKSLPRLAEGILALIVRARSSAVEHYLDMVGVTGSIPVAPTTSHPGSTAQPGACHGTRQAIASAPLSLSGARVQFMAFTQAI